MRSGSGTVVVYSDRDAFDTFTRTRPPVDGSDNWGIAEKQPIQWQGSGVGAFVDGTSGVLGIYALPAAKPAWALANWDYVWDQEQFLNWNGDIVPLDITFDAQLNRPLAPSDTQPFGTLNDWGDCFTVYYGDGPPWGGGKFAINFAGNQGGANGGANVDLFDDGMSVPDREFFAPIPVDMTQPFRVRVVYNDAASDIDLFIGQLTDPQPLVPLVSIHQSQHVLGHTWSNHGLTFDLITDNRALASPLELHVDTLWIGAVGDVAVISGGR